MGDNFPNEIDLVMKGGISSGVVYPRAVQKLSEGTRIRSVGGTSAGAIAAAITAAAEHGRAGATRPFDFSALESELAQEGYLLGLFPPSPETSALFDLLVKARRESVTRDRQAAKDTPAWRSAFDWARIIDRLLAAAQRDPGGPALVVGAVVLGALGASSALLLAGVQGPFATAVALASLTVVAALALAAGLATRLLWNARPVLAAARALVDPDVGQFGFCAGHGERGEGLTDWLHRHIQAQAGRAPGDPLLTFHDLAQPGEDRTPVELRMVTTNLSRSESTGLPFARDGILFKRADFEAMFPKEVVDALARWEPPGGTRIVPPDGYCRLPDGGALPVVVATRLSLSFPGLLRAVRLYVVPGAVFGAREKAGEQPPFKITEGELQPQWFSDGGVTSNFPLHVFDAWMPERPTIGISLADAPLATAMPKPIELPKDEPAERERVRMRTAREHPGGTELRSYREINGPVGFLASVLDSARNHADNAQMGLASYRERVVEVELDADEGGLNLDMDVPTVRGLQARGGVAGEVVRARFDPQQHRWVRFRVLMALVEEELACLEEQRAQAAGGRLAGIFDALAAAQREAADAGRPWYRPESAEWCRRASERVAAIDALLDRWGALDRVAASQPISAPERLFRDRAPAPGGVLRVTPAL